MTPRRHRPITTIQALVGTAGLVAAVAALIGLSHLLLLPSSTSVPLPPPEVQEGEDVRPGDVTCPTRGDLDRRPQPMPVSSAELIECPELFDGEVVRYSGEAVGAVLLRETHGWLHLNDDLYGNEIGPLSRHRTVVGGNSGMAVSVPRSAAEGVVVGNSRTHGTGVAVVGQFFKAYAGDGGAPTIVATDVRILREAEQFTHATSLPRVIAVAVLVPVVLVLLVLRRRQQRMA